MRSAATVVAASLVCGVCGIAAAGQPVPPAAGSSSIRLKAGESVQPAGGDLRIGFNGVDADSRCPKGEQCIWAGDATARVWLQRGSGPRAPLELHTAAGRANNAAALDHDVRLLALDPVPVAGNAIAPRDYVVTLLLTRGRAADPER